MDKVLEDRNTRPKRAKRSSLTTSNIWAFIWSPKQILDLFRMTSLWARVFSRDQSLDTVWQI